MTARRVGSAVLALLVVGILILAANLDPAALNPLVYALTFGAWLCVVLLIGPTLIQPRIPVLSERTFVAFVIALLGSISSVIVYNSEHGRILFDVQTAALLFREAIVAVLLIPSVWVVLFLTGRLGQDK